MAGSLRLTMLLTMLVAAAFDSSSAGETKNSRAGKMTFEEEWKSDAAPSTCTCTCYPAPSSPSSQRSPVERKRSPPPDSPVYLPSPSSPISKSPVSFSSPPPYGDAPSYEQPSPVVVTSPQTFVPSPPPPPAY